MKKYDAAEDFMSKDITVKMHTTTPTSEVDTTSSKSSSKKKDKVELVHTSKAISKSKKTKFDVGNVQKIVDLQFPRKVKAGSKFTKSMSIEVGYIDKSGKNRIKTVYFGDPKRSDYIDHKNIDIKERFINATPKAEHEFQSNFYEIYLLNGKEPDLMQNYYKLKDLMLTTK